MEVLGPQLCPLLPPFLAALVLGRFSLVTLELLHSLVM